MRKLDPIPAMQCEPFSYWKLQLLKDEYFSKAQDGEKGDVGESHATLTKCGALRAAAREVYTPVLGSADSKRFCKWSMQICCC